MLISKIISGGQTGVDRGAIAAAQELGFPYGGLIPKGRLATGPRESKCPGIQESTRRFITQLITRCVKGRDEK